VTILVKTRTARPGLFADYLVAFQSTKTTICELGRQCNLFVYKQLEASLSPTLLLIVTYIYDREIEYFSELDIFLSSGGDVEG